MIKFTQGNLLDAEVEALVNTVNTVGVMGKGVALMFKERFAQNYQQYVQACKSKSVTTGKMFVTRLSELNGPRWVVNFPTKQHWRGNSRMEWIVEGLQDLRRFLVEEHVRSIAIPPLGSGNGGLDWPLVREQIQRALGDLNVDILVFEPTKQYQNVSKRKGVETLTPARALIAELVRRYWVLGMECSLLEIQKLAWFLERAINRLDRSDNPLDLRFEQKKFGPYADRLRHVLEGLDGSYLRADKRITDSNPLDVIWFDDSRNRYLHTYLNSEGKAYLSALEETASLIDGFESPFGMELLATVDWLLFKQNVAPNVTAIRDELTRWPAGGAERKTRLFDDRAIKIALQRLTSKSQQIEVNAA